MIKAVVSSWDFIKFGEESEHILKVERLEVGGAIEAARMFVKAGVPALIDNSWIAVQLGLDKTAQSDRDAVEVKEKDRVLIIRETLEDLEAYVVKVERVVDCK